MGEEKKPSSLRSRIDRTRSAYDRKGNPAPIIVGAAFILVVGVVLYFVAFSTPPAPIKRQNKPPTKLLEPPAQPNYGPASGRGVMPLSDETQVYQFVEEAKQMAEKDAAAAVEKLKGGLGRWQKYDAELYFSMAICIGKQETKLQGPALQQMWTDKAGYYQKALDSVNAGGKFAYGKHDVRLNNLKTVLRVSRQKAGM